MAQQLEAMMSMFGGPSSGGPPGEGMPDMQKMMASLMGGMGGGGLPGDRLLGDMDDPAGLGGLGGGGGLPPNMFESLGLGDMGAMGGGGGFPSFPGMGGPMVKVKSKTEKYFPLVHFLAVLGLSVFVVGWWEPSLSRVRWGTTEQLVGGSWVDRWRLLAPSGRGIWGGVKSGLGLGMVEQLVRYFPLGHTGVPYS